MKNSTILALGATLLASTVIAKPMVHPHLHHKRNMVTVTVTEDVLEIVNVVVTVYNGGAATSTGLHTTLTTRHADKVNKAVEATSSSQLAPAKEAIVDPSPAPLSAIVDDTVEDEPSTKGNQTPEEIQQGYIDQQQGYIDEQKKTNKEKEQENADHSKNLGVSSAPVAAPIVTESKASAIKPAKDKEVPKKGNEGDHSGGNTEESNGGGGAPSGGACGKVGGKCSGDLTIYDDQGAGACGWTMDTETEDYFALSKGAMGEYSNNDYVDASGNHVDGTNKNAYCGRMALISVGGKTFPAKLTDKCGGCQGMWDIDVSKSLWEKLYPAEAKAFTRKPGVNWWFTSDAKWSPA